MFETNTVRSLCQLTGIANRRLPTETQRSRSVAGKSVQTWHLNCEIGIWKAREGVGSIFRERTL